MKVKYKMGGREGGREGGILWLNWSVKRKWRKLLEDNRSNFANLNS